MLDTDGTSYGVLPNGWAVSPEDVITYGLGCTFRPDWQMALCPPFREGFTLIAARISLAYFTCVSLRHTYFRVSLVNLLLRLPNCVL